MQKIQYTDEKNILLILALLKKHNIKKAITSPGSTNHTLVKSMQNDPYFELYSSVDERSAAYMACGLCSESGEPVVITCTEATASRNYMPGLTEAFYRKLPILAIATTHGRRHVGNLVAQVIDHSVVPNDVAVYHNYIPEICTEKDYKAAELIANEAMLALFHRGGGPVYLTLESVASRNYSVTELPNARKISRHDGQGEWPTLPNGRIGIFAGAHRQWAEPEVNSIEKFCEATGAVVFCDHTSGYYGRYKVNYSLAGSQDMYRSELSRMRLLVSVGEVSGDYFSGLLGAQAAEVWRVSQDGRLADQWGNLSNVFEMPEECFFSHYALQAAPANVEERHSIELYREERAMLEKHIPELPFSKVWMARQVVAGLPADSYIHFSILGSLRACNFFDLPEGVKASCNVGGFGIDGATSTLIGASLANKDKLHFLMTGDLAFFYDLNAIGNRHIGPNVRILLVNNGDGTEFRMYWHPISAFSKEDADRYMAAGGHFGNRSRRLVRDMAADLGFEYMSATNKEEFSSQLGRFLHPEVTEKPIVFEAFTDSEVDSEAVKAMRNLVRDDAYLKREAKRKVKEAVKGFLGNDLIDAAKKVLK